MCCSDVKTDEKKRNELFSAFDALCNHECQFLMRGIDTLKCCVDPARNQDEISHHSEFRRKYKVYKYSKTIRFSELTCQAQKFPICHAYMMKYLKKKKKNYDVDIFLCIFQNISTFYWKT